MKSSLWDYVLSGLYITAFVLLSAGAVAVLLPFSRQAFGDFHVLVDAALFVALFGLLCAAAVRILWARQPLPMGSHALDSPLFARWKLLTVLYHLGRGALRPLVPFFMLPVVDLALGARVGSDVAFGGMIDDPYLVSIGDEVVLGHNSLVTGSYLSGGQLVVGAVAIGKGATIGANALVFPDVVIGAGANVMSGACVMPGSRIPAGEIWRGNPARKWL